MQDAHRRTIGTFFVLRAAPTGCVLGFVLFALHLNAAAAAQWRAIEHERREIYHSPQTPGYTCWVGAWLMPDGDLMVACTQATGPAEGRESAPADVMQRLNWYPQYDMTGLELRNVQLRSPDGGATWQTASADLFRSCMNGVTGEAQTALPDGTILRGVWGFYLPYDPQLPQTGFLQRSTDGTLTWGEPELLLDPQEYLVWPRRIRVLRDGRVLLLAGVARAAVGTCTRVELSQRMRPSLLISADDGCTWDGPLPVVADDQPDDWTEEFDAAELANGDLLCIFRRQSDAHRWQSVLPREGDRWLPATAAPTTLPHSGQPELLATREGPVLHVATSGIHWTEDAGQTWTPLEVPGTAYYPRCVQQADGTICVFGHVGGDNPYGHVDQAIVMDCFRLSRVAHSAGRGL